MLMDLIQRDLVVFVISKVKRYMANEVNDEKAGANKTQMFLMSTGNPIAFKAEKITEEVTIKPGYNVPPVTLPKGYQVLSSNQFKKS
ncbi:unnamed protein product [Ambrosiozyma monospora]|uniref:Unnamed protein product n=1 Tax=Ambrosiozyma monospora TaxID=43982 RepID=A0A9W6YX27_AMBMO|nr:unnamed protein product [Ambrosiozyma monospora]